MSLIAGGITGNTSDAAALPAASDTVSGIQENATAAETTTGTSATRTVTPDGLAGSNYGKRIIKVKVIANNTALSTGDNLNNNRFTIPAELHGWNLVGVRAHVFTVSSSGLPTFQIHNFTDTADMLSTALTIDANEKDSKDATTAAVIDTGADDVAEGDELQIDCDGAGTGTAGAEIDLVFQLP